jgi:hypothetical protein
MLSLALGWKIRKICSCVINCELIPAYGTKLANRDWETTEILRFTVNLTLTA